MANAVVEEKHDNVGKKGINAIELDKDQISLVYWFTEGSGKKFVSRGSYELEGIPGTLFRRAVLNRDRWEYVKSRTELLGRKT
ncbi:MAG: hypothetical protein LBR93_08270 [Treponema sp.]|jgi:hypothetical protein|nr:hypothetical protein [Treponema sp.]